ncbi:MAG: hypothetical protein HP491_18765 [Nitrospira sp.]|nr:hypothetical protein [Nitrospira sp.]MBH0182013.1 hypothetical protein [Nitrospira sp.]MBH0187249.1 hypothetical protein [Nitrospira sp.]
MKRFRLVWALLVCLVLMNGLMAVPSVTHAEHHGTHHDAGTHASGICAWLCAAGQEVEASSVNLTSVLQLVGLSGDVFADPTVLLFSSDLFARGPPVLSL